MKIGDLYFSHLPRCKFIMGFADESRLYLKRDVRIDHNEFCTVLHVDFFQFGRKAVPSKHVRMLTSRGPAWVDSSWFHLDREGDGLHPVT